MKHLLNGIAIAAVFAISAPALAQNAPMTPASPPAKAAPAATSTAAPTKRATAMPRKPMHHRMARRGMSRGMSNEGDRMTDDLNRQELARLQGGGAPMPPGGGGMAPQGGGMQGMQGGGMQGGGMQGMQGGGMAPQGGGMSAPPPPPSR